MSLSVLPPFQAFLVLIRHNQINGWTSKEIWNSLNFSKNEKQTLDQQRQQLYRLLRKLVKQGYLIKSINMSNCRLSTYTESEAMKQLRKPVDSATIQNDFERIELKTEQLKEETKIFEKQIIASEQAIIDFPSLRNEIMQRKSQLLQDIEKLKAYNDFLVSLVQV